MKINILTMMMCALLIITLIIYVITKIIKENEFTNRIIQLSKRIMIVDVLTNVTVLFVALVKEKMIQIPCFHINISYWFVLFLVLIFLALALVIGHVKNKRVCVMIGRFVLDSMPGRQMQIDALLSMGEISEDEAKNSRQELINNKRMCDTCFDLIMFLKKIVCMNLICITLYIAICVYLFCINKMQQCDIANSIIAYSVASMAPVLITEMTLSDIVKRKMKNES